MEEKPAELPVSEQEVQIPSPSFLDKLKIHKLKILVGVLGIFVFAGVVSGAYKLGQRQIQPTTPTPTQEVTITTDRTEYTQGEEIMASLSYYTRVYTWQGYSWSIQRMENNSWVTVLRRGDPFFFCSNIPECKDINLNKVEECLSIALCEREMWYEVKDAPKLTWDQSYKVEEKTFQCKFIQRLPGGRVTSEEMVSRTCAVFDQVPPGKYKIKFEYALSIDPNDRTNRDIEIKYAEKEFTIK